MSRICCNFENLISISGHRQCIWLYMSLTRLGLELTKEKQPVNFRQAKSAQLDIQSVYMQFICICAQKVEKET